MGSRGKRGERILAIVPLLLAACSTLPPVQTPPKPEPIASNCKPEFWQQLEAAESGNDPRTMYREDGIKDRDRVTGLKVIFSEGPYQLSYSDVLNYGPACDFQFERDKALFMADVKDHMTGAKSFKAKNAGRLILSHAKQQECAEAIVKKLGPNSLGRYWSAVRDRKVKASCK